MEVRPARSRREANHRAQSFTMGRSQGITQARRFEGLGAASAKPMDTPPMVEASPRPLTKLAPPINDDGEPIAAE